MHSRNKYPGKFEGCESAIVAETLYNICGISGQSEDIGSVEENGIWFALIHGKRFSFIVSEDAYGFFEYSVFDNKKDAIRFWENDIESSLITPPQSEGEE